MVRATDINGIGNASPIASYVSCVPPSGMDPPIIESVNETSFIVSWDLPKSDGGCEVTGYALYSDYGNGGLINLPVDVADIANQPYLFKH